ncbi:cytochrome P450 [Colletotrichum sublineola]|nr:cytochrome P450 [Colletotrichum sublineola]
MAGAALCTWLVFLILHIAAKRHALAGIPLVGTELGGLQNRRHIYRSGGARDLYLDGYRKFKGMAFRITTSKDVTNIIVPPEFMPELKALPDDVLSASKAIEESMFSRYTGVQASIDLLPHTIKTSLTPSLGRISPVIADEAADALRAELPQANDWTEVSIMEPMLRVIIKSTGRMAFGSEICRDEEYIMISANYTMDIVKAVKKVAMIKPWLRPFLASRTAEVETLRRRITQAENILSPLISARRAAAVTAETKYQRPDDMLQWMMDSESKFGARSNMEFARYSLGIILAAIYTTSLIMTNVFYTLAAMPEVIPVLRSDIKQALANHGGVFNNSAVQEMKKVDSFLKETVRFYPMLPTSFQRKVLKSFKLSNGQTIPKGSLIELPVLGINNDDCFFPDHGTFDPWRFYRMRQTKAPQETSSRTEGVGDFQFASVGPTSLLFGYGRHACPGRFFVAYQMKVILALTLMNYDLANLECSKQRIPGITNGSVVSNIIHLEKSFRK